jgi:SAM-dependent methyltransferase
MTSAPYYQEDLAWVHHVGYGHLAEHAAPGILRLVQRANLRRGASVLEVGSGSGRLARVLVDAGYAVLGMDASPAMVDLARRHAPEARFEVRSLPTGKPTGAPGGLPAADAVVSTGHVLNYLDSPADIDAALRELAGAVRPGGVLALDLMTERFARAHERCGGHARVEEDWAVITRDSRPGPLRLHRRITVFRRVGDGWRREDEHHRNVTCEPAEVLAVLEACGITAEERAGFGDEPTPDGLVVLLGVRR